ncbi:helix-turn-helix domain-containing protein [Candidatus Microgenomates bacterium]|nr:helix-turn-helix domain-containing protein [Candidatus Microgenomates bacterium]
MKTIGQILKEARLTKSFSKSHLEGLTKIKKDFIEAIEEEQWHLLPEYPVVRGFVKSMADSLDMNSDQALAFLRRDYPPQKATVNPKPDVGTKFIWTPKLTFLTGMAVVLVIVLGYLTLQYVGFISPPKLEVAKPTESEVILSSPTEVDGVTDPGVTIKINNQPTLIEDDGSFKALIEVNSNTNKVEVVATSRSGKVTSVIRNIKVELKK